MGCFWLWCLSQYDIRRTVPFFFVFYISICHRKGQPALFVVWVYFSVQQYTVLLSVLFFSQMKRCPEANASNNFHTVHRALWPHISMRARCAVDFPGRLRAFWTGCSILVCQFSPRLSCSEDSRVNIHPALWAAKRKRCPRNTKKS